MLIWFEMLKSGLQSNWSGAEFIQFHLPGAIFIVLDSISGCFSVHPPERIGQGPVWFLWGLGGAESRIEELGSKPRSYCWECTNRRGGVAKSRTCHGHRARAGQVETGWAGTTKGEVRGSSRRLSNGNIWRLHILSFKKEMITLGFSLLSSLIKFKGPKWKFLRGEDEENQGPLIPYCIAHLLFSHPNWWQFPCECWLLSLCS